MPGSKLCLARSEFSILVSTSFLMTEKTQKGIVVGKHMRMLC